MCLLWIAHHRCASCVCSSCENRPAVYKSCLVQGLESQLASMEDDLSDATEAVEAMRRRMALAMVYHQFDLDGNGSVGEEELLELGQARRRLGQKHGEWTIQNTHALLQTMIGDGDEGQYSHLIDVCCVSLMIDSHKIQAP